MFSVKHEIRPAIAADRAQWEPLWQGHLRFYETSLADEVIETQWQRVVGPALEAQCRVDTTEARLYKYVICLVVNPVVLSRFDVSQ